MRGWWSFGLAMMVGCQVQPGLSLAHLSTMENETRGLVLAPDGLSGHAAMWGTTCSFDTLNGWIIWDEDLPTEAEEIDDTWEGVVLGHSEEGAHHLEDRDADVAISGVVTTRQLALGTAILRVSPIGDCQARLGDTVVTVAPELCDAGASVDSDRRDTLYVATGDGVVAVDEDGASTLDDAGDLIARDHETHLIYVAEEGEDLVWALDRDGAVAWTAEVPGGVRALDDMGERAMASVLVDAGDHGELVFLDGWTGALVQRYDTPTANGDLVVSDDGTTLSVVMSNQVLFFDVTADDEEPKERMTLGSESPIFSD